MLEVDRQAAFVGVEHGERKRYAETAPLPQDFAAQRFDLHDIRARMGQQETGIRAVVNLPKVENLHAFERPTRLIGHIYPFARSCFDRLMRRQAQHEVWYLRCCP